jgi:hypothetical protein
MRRGAACRSDAGGSAVMVSPCCHAACYIAKEAHPFDQTRASQWCACSACNEACDPITEVPDAGATDG